MIIGFDGSRAFASGKTGTENYSFQLLKALSGIDKENRYVIYVRPHSVIPSFSSVSNKLRDPSLIVQDDNRKWPKNFEFRVLKWSRLWTQGGLALQTFKDKLDVLFVPAHTLPIIRRPGLKTVVTVHDLGSEYLPSMHQVKQRLYLGFMQKMQLKGSSKIIAVSKATKDDLIKRIGIDAERISVIYEGFDNQVFKPIKGDLLVNSLKEYGLKPREYFLFVGTVQPRKNLERLISSFAQFIDRQPGKDSLQSARGPASSVSRRASSLASLVAATRRDPLLAVTPRATDSNFAVPNLVIAGSKGWLSDEIYKLPKELGISKACGLATLEDRVKFLGYVPEKDLPALYSGAIALTFPSLFEGFGLPILEAQACGCPVLTSEVSSMPEVAGKGAVYVDPYSIDDIVKGMERVKREGERVKLIQNGFENIKRFSWGKCARETLEMLKDA